MLMFLQPEVIAEPIFKFSPIWWGLIIELKCCKGFVVRGLGFNGVQLTSYCLRSGLGQWLAVLGQHTGGIGYSGLSEAISIFTVLVESHSLVLLIQFTLFPSLFTFPLESPVFIGISRGEEWAQLFTTLQQEMLGGWRVVKSRWRGESPLHPYNILIYSDFIPIGEEWRGKMHFVCIIPEYRRWFSSHPTCSLAPMAHLDNRWWWHWEGSSWLATSGCERYHLSSSG